MKTHSVLPVPATQSQSGAWWLLLASDSLCPGSAMEQEALGGQWGPTQDEVAGKLSCHASPEAARAHAIIRQWADDRVS